MLFMLFLEQFLSFQILLNGGKVMAWTMRYAMMIISTMREYIYKVIGRVTAWIRKRGFYVNESLI